MEDREIGDVGVEIFPDLGDGRDDRDAERDAFVLDLSVLFIE